MHFLLRNLVCSIALILLTACKHETPTSILSLESGWVRVLPPGSESTAAYGIFVNHGDRPIEITGFGSDSFASVSLHVSTVENGVSRMQPIPALVQAAGSSTELHPGGLHLMMMHPVRELHPGDQVKLYLTTVEGTQFQFSLPVEAR